MGQSIQIALQHHQAGRLAEAEKIYREILTHRPDDPGALHLLGMLTGQTGRLEEAADLFQRAVRADPKNAEDHKGLGDALRYLGRIDESMAAYRKAIQLNPDFAMAHNNLAISLATAGQMEDAIASHRHAIRLNPNLPEPHNHLGSTLAKLGRLDEAIASYHQAIRLRPDYAAAYSNLGNALKDSGQLKEAAAACRRAIALKPDYPEAYSNLGIALKGLCQIDEAIAAYEQAIRLKADYAAVFSNLSNSLKDMGRLDDAIAACRQAIQLKPDLAEAPSNLLLTLNYHPDWSGDAISAEHRAWGGQNAALANQSISFTNERSPGKKLRIGYVSADFRRHAVGAFFIALPEHHDRNAIEVFCYSNVLHPDDMTERIKRSCNQWRSIVGLHDDAVARLIRSDAIDILVDLSGHTSGNRLRVFASKPAPVQVTYLGYANTTGLAAIDYRLTDALADPPGMTEHLNVERLWRLPGCAWCYEPREHAPEVKPRAQGPITFGCFNAFAKINSKLIAIWAELLKRVPESRLILKSAGAGVASAQKRLMDEFAKHTIVADRIELTGWIDQPRRHMELYERVDVALDTYPYHGTTTTCEALWMGVPVVTLAGNTHVSRVGVSLLNCVGLPECIAQSAENYISIAAGFAADLPRLVELRRNLRQRMASSPLVDAPQFVRNIEAAYRQMWQCWCESK